MPVRTQTIEAKLNTGSQWWNDEGPGRIGWHVRLVSDITNHPNRTGGLQRTEDPSQKDRIGFGKLGQRIASERLVAFDQYVEEIEVYRNPYGGCLNVLPHGTFSVRTPTHQAKYLQQSGHPQLT